MSFRTDVLPVIDRARALRGASGVDIQMVSVSIVGRTWSGGRRGAGLMAATVMTALPQRYRMRIVSEKEVASSGGRYSSGDIRVGPITPAYAGGGFTPAQLKPEGQTGSEIVYVLSGTTQGDYQLVDIQTLKAFSYFLVLRFANPTQAADLSL